jgi:HPt (histidine-containing phosphotransfer) domain-containing protein
MVGSKERCLEAGCTGFVAKPVEMDTLFRAIKESLNIPEVSGDGRASSPVPPRKAIQTGHETSRFPLSPEERAESGLPLDDDSYSRLLADFRDFLQSELERMIQAVHRSDCGALIESAGEVGRRAEKVGYRQFRKPAEHLVSVAREKGPADAIRRAVGDLIARSETLRIPSETVPLARRGQPARTNQVAEEESSLPPIRTTLPLDDPGFVQILAGFVNHLGTQLVEIDHAWQERDFDSLAKLALWLKGAGGTLGFDVFTGPAQQLQQRAKQQRSEEIEPLLKQLHDLYDRIEAPVLAEAPVRPIQTRSAGE